MPQSAVERETISSTLLSKQLLELGVKPGGVLLVHTAFSQVRPVEHGPLGLIAVLQAVLGPQGTLVMPSMTDDYNAPFDPKTTPCTHLGIVADTFWRLPGVLRSNSPHAFAASGPNAARITAPHPIDRPHGLDSPIGRIYELDGQVLLLGVGHDDNTTVHLAETLANVRYRRRKSVIIAEDGKPTRIDYDEIDHCCQNFNLVDNWLEEQGLQHKGQVGYATVRLARSQDIVAMVMAQLRTHDLIFLHPEGVDSQCDEARASLKPV